MYGLAILIAIAVNPAIGRRRAGTDQGAPAGIGAAFNRTQSRTYHTPYCCTLGPVGLLQAGATG